MNDSLGTGFETEKGLVGGCAYDAHGAAISDDDMAKSPCRRRGDAGCSWWSEVGFGAL